MKTNKIDGSDKGRLFLFALSTCIWCRKTKTFLDENKVAYEFVFVDELEGSEKEEARETLKKWNPSCSYPTLVIDNDRCIVGFDEDNLRMELKL